MARCEVLLNVSECQQESARAKCHACGNTVCTSCSAIMERHGRRVRVCNDCQEEDKKDGRWRPSGARLARLVSAGLDDGEVLVLTVEDVKKKVVVKENGKGGKLTVRRCLICRDSWFYLDPPHHDRGCLLREVRV